MGDAEGARKRGEEMKIKEIIALVDESNPNVFTEKLKRSWLLELDGRILTEVWARPLTEAMAYEQGEETLLSLPYQGIYQDYLGAMIDRNNGEYDRYASSMAFYNQSFSQYAKWFIGSYEPGGRPSQHDQLIPCVTYQAEAGEPFYLATLPGSALLMTVTCTIDEAFNSGTGDVLTLGTKEAPELLLAAGEINPRTTGVYRKTVYTFCPQGGAALFATWTPTGTDATAGRARFDFEYYKNRYGKEGL